MKNYKRLVTLLMVMCIAFSCSAYATGDTTTITPTTDKTATATVSLDLGEQQPTSYTVVIPSKIPLNSETGTGSATITLKSGFVFTDVTGLGVYLNDIEIEEEGEYTDKGYLLLENESNGQTVKCYLTFNNDTDLVSSNAILQATSATDNQEDRSVTMDFTVPDMPSYGTYTGTLTFTIITPAAQS